MGQDWLAVLYIISFFTICGVVEGNWQGLGRVCSIEIRMIPLQDGVVRQDGLESTDTQFIRYPVNYSAMMLLLECRTQIHLHIAGRTTLGEIRLVGM